MQIVYSNEYNIISMSLIERCEISMICSKLIKVKQNNINKCILKHLECIRERKNTMVFRLKQLSWRAVYVY